MPGTWSVSSEIRFATNGITIMNDLADAVREASLAMADFNVLLKESNDLLALMNKGLTGANARFNRQAVAVDRAAAAMSGYTAAARGAATAGAAASAAGKGTGGSGGGGGHGGGFGFFGSGQHGGFGFGSIGGSIGSGIGGMFGKAAGMAGGPIGSAIGEGVGKVGGMAVDVAKDAAIGAVGFGVDAVVEAGKLQRQLTQIKIATNASKSQMAQLSEASYQISADTAQSAEQAAHNIAIIASSGINDPTQLLARYRKADGTMSESFAETITKFADVQYLKSGGKVSFDEAAKEGIIIAHQEGARTPQEIAPILDLVTKASNMMPDILKYFLTQRNQYAAVSRSAGVPINESMMMGVWMDQNGMGKGRGGSGIQAIITGLTAPTKGMLAAQEKLGLRNRNGLVDPRIAGYDKNGRSTLSLVEFLKLYQRRMNQDMYNANRKAGGGKAGLAASAQAERTDLGLMKKAIGVQGGRVAWLGDTAKGINGLIGLFKKFRELPGVDDAQAALMANMFSQAQLAWSNLQSLATEVGTSALPGVTEAFHAMAGGLQQARTWLHANGALEARIQQDVLNAVKGVENWLVSNKQGWISLRTNLGSLYNAALKLGPELAIVAQAALDLANIVLPVLTNAINFAHGLYDPGHSKSGIIAGDLSGTSDNDDWRTRWAQMSPAEKAAAHASAVHAREKALLQTIHAPKVSGTHAVTAGQVSDQAAANAALRDLRLSTPAAHAIQNQVNYQRGLIQKEQTGKNSSAPAIKTLILSQQRSVAAMTDKLEKIATSPVPINIALDVKVDHNGNVIAKIQGHPQVTAGGGHTVSVSSVANVGKGNGR